MVTVEHADGPTWRPSIPFRIVISFNLAPFSAVIGFVAWVILPTGRLPGWWFLVLAVPLGLAWLWFGGWRGPQFVEDGEQPVNALAGDAPQVSGKTLPVFGGGRLPRRQGRERFADLLD